MSDQISHFRRSALDGQSMLRLPVGPEFWGAAGPHQIHDLPPLGVVAACRRAWAGACTVAGWLAGLRRRAAVRAAPGLTPAAAAR